MTSTVELFPWKQNFWQRRIRHLIPNNLIVFEFSNLCFFVHSTIAPRSNKNCCWINHFAHYSKKFQSYFDHDESYYSPCIIQKILSMTRLCAIRHPRPKDHPKPSNLNRFIIIAQTSMKTIWYNNLRWLRFSFFLQIALLLPNKIDTSFNKNL